MPQNQTPLDHARALEAARSAAHPFGEGTVPAGSIPQRVFSGAARRMIALLASASLPRPSRVVFSLIYEDGKEERFEMDTAPAPTSSNGEAAPSRASPKLSPKLRPRPD